MAEQLNLGLQFRNGIARPVEGQDGFVPIAALRPDGSFNYDYVDPAILVPTASVPFATSLAPFQKSVLLRDLGDGTLRPQNRPRVVRMQDTFTTGTTISGGIGQLNWTLLGTGLPLVQRNSGNNISFRPLQLVTGGASGNISILTLGDTATRDFCTAAQIRILQLQVANVTSLNDRFFFGLSSDLAAAPGTASDEFGFVFDDSINNNWHLIVRVAGVGALIDTGVLAGARLLSLWQPTPGTFQFRADETLLGQFTSDIPTANMALGIKMEALSSGAKLGDLGTFNFESTDLTGVSDNDSFLDA